MRARRTRDLGSAVYEFELQRDIPCKLPKNTSHKPLIIITLKDSTTIVTACHSEQGRPASLEESGWAGEPGRSLFFPSVTETSGVAMLGMTTVEERRSYVTLDDPTQRELATAGPALLLQRYPPPVLIDEVQYAPQLLSHIKMEADRDPKPGRFSLTGSKHSLAMREVTESIAETFVISDLRAPRKARPSGRRLRGGFARTGAVAAGRGIWAVPVWLV
jgi:hypothetical protein